MTHPGQSARPSSAILIEPDATAPEFHSSARPSSTFHALGLAQRLGLFALLFAAEGIPCSILIRQYRGAVALLQIAIVFGGLLFAIGYAKSRAALAEISRELKETPISWRLLGAHFTALLCFIGLSLLPASRGLPDHLIGAAWYSAGFLSIALAACALIPIRILIRLARATGYAWIYALAAGFIAHRLVIYSSLWNGAVWDPANAFSWKPATDFTFKLVEAMLRLFLPNVVADLPTLTIGTAAFNVTILPWCAGFEGTALILVFSVAWLCFFRREYRFPQALLLVPVGMAVMWLSNAVRITALILIGVAGAQGMAVGGFHSQAGWIAFNCVALGFVTVSRRLPWFTWRETATRVERRAEFDPTAAYLMPFLAILTAGMLARAASSGFEWLYPLRFVAAIAALWFFRSEYSKLDWSFGWFSVAAGCAVFGLWMALDAAAGGHPADNGIGAGLAALPAFARIAWLAVRTAAAVVTVPIAEELAFRGFLIRRLISADFDALRARHYTLFAVLISSVAFGALHGSRWLAGTLAGLIYAIAFLRRGKIGDAVVAHALTNALLAAVVLLGGKWWLW